LVRPVKGRMHAAKDVRGNGESILPEEAAGRKVSSRQETVFLSKESGRKMVGKQVRENEREGKRTTLCAESTSLRVRGLWESRRRCISHMDVRERNIEEGGVLSTPPAERIQSPWIPALRTAKNHLGEENPALKKVGREQPRNERSEREPIVFTTRPQGPDGCIFLYGKGLKKKGTY